MKYFYQPTCLLAIRHVFRFLMTGLIVLLLNFSTNAQCPPNIDFEQGDFTGWQCWTGSVSGAGAVNNIIWNPVTPVTPVPQRHLIESGNAKDPYGLFPKKCPNGSGYSVKLGNDGVGSQAEGISYTFTIPANQNTFSLTYYYAIVLHQGGHAVYEQARMIVTVENLTDATPLPCPLDPFIVGTSLQGFMTSTTPPPPGASAGAIVYKNWAAATINLDGNAGKTIRIFFKTADCTNSGHFGYAYIDIAAQCSSAFTGATFCPDDAFVTVTAPYGYASYQWWNGTHTVPIAGGTTQTITLNPPPLSGDSITVDLEPFNGYGCPTTLKAYLWDTLTVKANAGADKKTCDNKPVQLGVAPEPGRIYKWTPAAGLSNPDIANPIATPSVTTQYTLTVTNSGGGCATPDVVNVTVAALSDAIELIGSASYCTASGQSAVLKLTPLDADSIQWYQDGNPIPGAPGHQTQITITQTGAYYAKLFSFAGCERTTAIQQINIYESPVAGFNLNTATQCDLGNQFVFTNTSTLTTGNLAYDWDFGDGSTAGLANVTHSYTKPGTYTVKLVVTAPGNCTDTKSVTVTVHPSPTAVFAVDAAQQCFKNNWFTFSNSSTVSTGTLNYAWDFGDGNIDNTKDVGHHYTAPGTYQVKLNARETVGGCADDSIFTIIVQESPIAAFTIDNNVQCFPGHRFALTNTTFIPSEPLSYTWYFGDGTTQTLKDVNYSYAKAGDYTITMIAYTAFGCKDTTVHAVIVHPTPAADFSVRPVCEDLAVPVINRTYNNTTSTVNYMWDFGDGHLDNVKTPVYSYPTAGTYPLSLTVTTVECPLSPSTKTISITIDAITPGIVYPDKDAAFNFPEPLSARSIGNSVTWSPATSLSNRFSYTPTFTGITPQLYTITLRTATGCVTVDTQLVKTHKKIEIYVPTGFTVNGDGVNDRLRPVLIGFTKVNYFRIYNRWGKLLFTQNSDQPGWDGKINNKPAETQTVVWMIEAVDIDGVVHTKQGTTVLFR